MTDPTSLGAAGSRARRLPAYRALLAVDVRDFSGYVGVDHATVTERIRPIMHRAFRRCGLGDVWEEGEWSRVEGDSYVGAFPSWALPMLLNPLLGGLQDQLEEENRENPVGHPPRPIRMRASVHVGPVTDASPGNPVADGSGVDRVETHRLLDADELKDLLNRSEDVTCVAAIVSERAYVDAVASGYAGEATDLYRRVTVAVKQYEGTAYLRVPRASGDLLDHGFGTGAARQETAPTDAARGDANDSGGVTGVGSVGRDAHGVAVGNHGPGHIGDTDNRRGRGRRRDG